MTDDLSGIPPAIAFTVFASKFARDQRGGEAATLAALAAVIRSGHAPDKPSLPWIKLAGFSGIPNPDSKSRAASLRYDAGVEWISGVEGDYDAKPKADGSLMAIEEAAELIERAGIEAVLFQTPSSTPQKPHWRILCPTWHQYRGDDLKATRARFLARVNGVLGGVLAGESFTLSQSYYFGGIEGKPPIKPIVIQGKRIDLLDALDGGAVYKDGATQPEAKREPAAAPDGLVESADDPDLIAVLREQIEAAIQREGIGETPTGARAFALVTWLLKLRVGDKIIEPEALQAILAEHWRDVADDLVENALAAIGDERGSVEIERMPEPAGRADTFDEAAEREFARERHMKAERALALILESRLPAAMKPDDVAQVEAFRAELRKPAGRKVMLGSIEALIADLNKPRSRFGFGGCRPSEGKRAPPLTYFDEHKTLPKVPHEGCIGFMIGSRGNHKTGTLIKYGLDACDAGYRVLFIAAEDAHGIKKLRLPAAIEARGREEDHYDDLWITESASLVLRSREHREDLIATFRDFAPNLVFIDVLAKTIAGSDVNAAKDAGEIVAAMEEIAKGFGGATVLATRHPPLATDGRGTGSNEFVSLAYFQWLISAAGGIVTVHADKIKNGPDDFDVRYKIVEGGGGVPVIAEASVSDLAEAQRRTVRAVGPDPIVADVIAVLIPSTPPISMGALSQRLRDQFPDRYSVLAEGDITTRVKNEVWGGSHGKRDGSRGPAAGPLAPYATINGLGTKHAVYEFWHQR
ncbi:MAG TPA: AAA family ATPase [Stellaceae bacterium]|jgi:hypothetical protein|nr:AAA family ATPase [Stellaceae bacterium]